MQLALPKICRRTSGPLVKPTSAGRPGQQLFRLGNLSFRAMDMRSSVLYSTRLLIRRTFRVGPAPRYECDRRGIIPIGLPPCVAKLREFSSFHWRPVRRRDKVNGTSIPHLPPGHPNPAKTPCFHHPAISASPRAFDHMLSCLPHWTVFTPAANTVNAAPPQPTDPRLKIDLFAETPQVVTPIGVAVDAKGRVFVVESHTHFPPPGYKGPKTDRILMLEDTKSATGKGRPRHGVRRGLEVDDVSCVRAGRLALCRHA